MNGGFPLRTIRAVSGRATCALRRARSGTIFRVAISGPGGRWTSLDLAPRQATDLSEVLALALVAEPTVEVADDATREGTGSAVAICGATAVGTHRNGRRLVVVDVAPYEPGNFSLEMSPAAARVLAHQILVAVNGEERRRGWRWPWIS